MPNPDSSEGQLAQRGPDTEALANIEKAKEAIREGMEPRSGASVLSLDAAGVEHRRYHIGANDLKDLENRFTYHPPKGDQVHRYAFLRSEALTLAKSIASTVPPGRERALALTHLETAIFFANAAIARNE